MSWDFSTDPITGDWAMNAGDLVRTELGDTAVLHQLAAHYDAWWGDPEVGSLLHQRDRYTVDPPGAIAAEIERSLGVLVGDRLIADLEVAAVEVGGDGRVEARTAYRLVEADAIVVGVLTLGGS